MKREIKFRAWDNKDQKWLLGYEYPNLGGFSMFGELMLFQEWSIILNRFILQQKDRKPDDLILMQFTGLKDKNGKEIYEGDIVETNRIYHGKPIEPMFKSKIVYNEFIGAWQIAYLNIDDNFVTDTIEFTYQLNIIGNIHENPDLLK